MKKRVEFIRHKGTEILYIDWSEAVAAEVLAAINEAKRLIALRPHASVRTLTNVRGTRMDRAVTEMLKDYVAHNKPYVIKGAVIGLNDLKMIAFNTVNRLTGRSLRAMSTEDEARQWLVEQ